MRVGCACGALLVFATFAGFPRRADAADGHDGDALHVRVRGAARIEAQGVRVDGSAMQLRGAVLDDVGMPIEKGAVIIRFARAATPGQPIALPSGADGCGSDGDARTDADGTVHVTTDAAGRFCTRVALPVERYQVEVRYAGSPLIDGASAAVPVDLARRACSLAFVPELRVVSLDERAGPRTLDATALVENDGTMSAGGGLPLTLGTERGPIGDATTDANGHAHFVFTPSALGPPGQGELRLSFAGNADTSATSRVDAIERHTRVTLEVDGAHEGELPAGAPEDGVTILVQARSASGDVTGGSVEARVNDVIVGAAPIEGGKARVVATFSVADSFGAATEVPITLRYIPSAPWFEPGLDSTWALPVRGRSPLRQAPLVLAGLALVAWFAASRAQRARVLAKSVVRATRLPSRGEAKLDVVRAARDPSEGWKGRALDADDETGIGTARVQIERPAFGRAEIMASVMTDDDGSFVLPPVSSRSGDELVFEAPLHVALRRPLPPAGELDAQLILRKRALLSRMVAWAKMRGRPFDARPDPTPGHVRRAAGDDFRVARWADAIERAAYGGEPVDAHIEADVDRLAPTPAAAPAPPSSGRGANEHALLNPTKPNR